MKQTGKPLDGSKVDVFFLVSVVSCDLFVSLRLMRLSFVSRLVLVVPFFLVVFIMFVYVFVIVCCSSCDSFWFPQQFMFFVFLVS